MRARNAAILAILTSVCMAVQLTPRPPNIEFTSLICFLTGLLFGSLFGMSVGTLTMLVNGFLSPWGFGGINIPFQILGMALIGFAGGVYRKYSMRVGNPSARSFSIEVAFLAVILTLTYDVITTLGYTLIFNVNLLLALITGIWFTITHVISNAVLFGTALYALVRISNKILGEQIWSYQKEP
jgi:hypothetical protein